MSKKTDKTAKTMPQALDSMNVEITNLKPFGMMQKDELVSHLQSAGITEKDVQKLRQTPAQLADIITHYESGNMWQATAAPSASPFEKLLKGLADLPLENLLKPFDSHSALPLIAAHVRRDGLSALMHHDPHAYVRLAFDLADIIHEVARERKAPKAAPSDPADVEP